MTTRVQAIKEQITVLYTDVSNAFPSLSHKGIDTGLAAAGVPHKVRAIVRVLYTAAQGLIKLNCGGGEYRTDRFDVNRGIMQGSVTGPITFVCALSKLLKEHDPARAQAVGPGEIPYVDPEGQPHETAMCKECHTDYPLPKFLDTATCPPCQKFLAHSPEEIKRAQTATEEYDRLVALDNDGSYRTPAEQKQITDEITGYLMASAYPSPVSPCPTLECADDISLVQYGEDTIEENVFVAQQRLDKLEKALREVLDLVLAPMKCVQHNVQDPPDVTHRPLHEATLKQIGATEHLCPACGTGFPAPQSMAVHRGLI